MSASESKFGPRSVCVAAVVVLASFAASALAQQAQVGGNGQQPVNAAVGAGNQNAFIGGNGVGMGNPFGSGQGGAASADFDSLIDLIISTVDADSWAENGTGEGDVMPFPNGVWVDAAGNLRVGADRARAGNLAAVREQGSKSAAAARRGAAKKPATSDARQASELRYVSLSRLEAAIAQRQAAHQPLEPAMLTLAGLERVQFVLVYPETGDLVLAGPAGDWRSTGEGIVSAETGRPVVRLDDLLTLWRRQRIEGSAAFGCSIVPRQEALARTQEFLNATASEPIEPSERRQWLGELRGTLGVQDVEYYNIDPDSRVAGVLLAADYHMKLVGMGLVKSVPGVKSYLATVRLDQGAPPPMAVLRWWFSMPESNVAASDARDAFAMPDSCVQVLSENEMLAARGERVHTGQSDELNSRFAKSFTAEFPSLADKYPIYGQLARVFELALALAVIENEGLADKVAWNPSLLMDGERLRLPRLATPKGVETVINHRVIGGRHIIAGVSGGVWVDGARSLAMTSAQGGVAASLASMRSKPTVAATGAADAESEEMSAATKPIVWWWD